MPNDSGEVRRLADEAMREYIRRVAEDFRVAELGAASNDALRLALDHTYRLSLLRVLWEIRYSLDSMTRT